MSYKIEFPPNNVLPKLFSICESERQVQVLEAVIEAEGSPTKAERLLVANNKPRLNDSAIGKMMRRLYYKYLETSPANAEAPRILIIDIETAPTLAWVWRMWKENVGMNQMVEDGYIMCFAAKWVDEDEIHYFEQRGTDDKEITRVLIDFLNEADIVVAHNGDRFDLPRINTAAIKNGLTPPSPYRSVDTLKIVKKHFKFARNTLANVARELDCTPKEDHANFNGFELWSECMAGNADAWEEMKKYNIQDVLTLEEVYFKLRPWHKEHPNVGIFYESIKPRCSKCGHDELVHNSYYRTDVSKFQVLKCKACNGFSRSRTSMFPKEIRGDLLTTVRS